MGIELENADKIKDVMDAILARIEEDDEDVLENLEERDYKGFSYWSVTDEAMERIPADSGSGIAPRREEREAG